MQVNVVQGSDLSYFKAKQMSKQFNFLKSYVTLSVLELSLIFQRQVGMFEIEKYGERMGQIVPSFRTLQFMDLNEFKSIKKLPQQDSLPPSSEAYRTQVHNLSQDYQLKNELSRYLRFLQSYGDFMDQHFEVIRPKSNFLVFWNVLNFIAIFLSFLQSFFIIFIISRIDGSWNKAFAQFSYGLGTIILLDMLLVRPRVSVSHNGLMVVAHSQLLDRYLSKYFAWDLITVVVLFLDSVTIPNAAYVRLLVFIKGFTFKQIKQQISIKLLGHPKLHIFYRLVRITFFVVFFSFLYGNIYAFLDIYYYQQQGYYYQNSLLWMTGSTKLQMINFYQTFQWYVWFQIGVFMVLQMVRGCGYGTPTPRSPPSQLFYSLAALTMTAIFTYFTKVFIDLLLTPSDQQQLIDKEYQALITTISSDKELQVNKFALFKFVRKLGKIDNALNLLDGIQERLSKKLLQDYNYSFKKYFVWRLKFLVEIVARNENQSFIMQLTTIIKVKNLHSSHIFYKANELAQEEIYATGQARVMLSRQNIGYQQLMEKWSIFGFRECFIDRKAIFQAEVKMPGIVKYITKQDFLSVMKPYQQIYESFLYKIQQVKLSEISTQVIELKCCVCGEFHFSERCPLLLHKQPSNLQQVVPERTQCSQGNLLTGANKVHPQMSIINHLLPLQFKNNLQSSSATVNQRERHPRKMRENKKLRHLISQSKIQIDEYSASLRNFTNFNL